MYCYLNYVFYDFLSVYIEHDKMLYKQHDKKTKGRDTYDTQKYLTSRE